MAPQRTRPHRPALETPGSALRRAGRTARIFLVLPALLLSACTGSQSTFAGAGSEAAAVEHLFWIMLVGAILVWVFTIGLSIYATKVKPERHSEKTGSRLIIFGAVFPTIVLAGLLVYGLALMPAFRAPADGPTIAISGERFWFRIAYDVEGEPGIVKGLPPGGVESANEIWLPVNTRTELLLGSPDVIHSLWVPAIAGKMDMIPGRVNRLVVEPVKEGVYNGVCAEFCGDAHAQMGFRVVVASAEDYAAHVSAQSEPAAITSGPGYEAFMTNGCDACHTVRGTDADGEVGPDLTHVGGRRTLAAGLIDNNAENLVRFIAATEHVKPGVQMPAYGMLEQDEIAAIASWLEQLK